ncbi:MAG: molybdopterin-binding protein [Sulfitobacter sp.]
MKFGPTPLSLAEGAVLAHSMSLPSGKMRKGRVLSSEDVAALRDAGTTEVIAAVLDETDVGENAAAAQLAQALAGHGTGVTISNAFTGRSNILAAGPGVVVLDVAAIEAVNMVHPMITVATVPQMQQMRSGGMIATIKIISYAVPGEALAAACVAAQDAVRLAVPELSNARLIITEVPDGAGEKGRDAIAARLEALGVDLCATQMVAHRVEALAGAIAASQEDLVLILTGSATSDSDDVAPAALRASGGHVERFGMPVDPGNLLFLGELKGRAIIGLPGCARSPALNGADWVLSRVVCGIAVSSGDIARMGVGGLLKEIPTRPQPRRGG